MPFQDDLAALIDGGLNRWHVEIRVDRSHHHDGLRRCGCGHSHDDSRDYRHEPSV
jgi:hypothetical protein